MAFAFAEVCALFENLERIEAAEPPLLPADKADRLRSTTITYFKSHRVAVDRLDIQASVALLSALLPERRPDRVYGIQATTLCRILSRCLNLGSSRARDLQAYKQPGRGDLGACVQRVFDKGGPPASPAVTLTEVDELLSWLACQCRFSNLAKAAPLPSSPSSEERDQRVGSIFKRLDAKDAKWLVRLILKDLSPLIVDEHLVLHAFHFLLPDLLRFQDDLQAATMLIKTSLKVYPSTTDPKSARLLKLNAASSLLPMLGVKVSRPFFHKARSIEHTLKMLGDRKWVLERKYDGEYCEIHIDVTSSQNPTEMIKIFSKSGKDSTSDRGGIHETLIRSLRLGQPGCKIKRQAILIGELVVWSDPEGKVMPFDEIRKHVTRSGKYIGTAQDSLPRPGEHLCIVFFDLLLLDDDTVMMKSMEQRRQVLRKLYAKIPGRAKGAEWKILDFSAQETSRKRLLEQFAASNAQRCEGLVLKPCGMPYFSIEKKAAEYGCSFIKLKKDYIAGLGDEADFAVIGASYDAQTALKSGMKGLKWTEFHLGALLNKDDVKRFDARPYFKVVGSIECTACIPRPILEAANAIGRSYATGYTSHDTSHPFGIQHCPGGKITTLFVEPFVFEVLGSGFQKPSNCNFFMLRHARVTKLHHDRSWKDCIGFSELQEMARESRSLGAESESQETRKHLARLEKTLKNKFDRMQTPSSVSRQTCPPDNATTRTSPCGNDANPEKRSPPGIRTPLNDVAVNSLPTPVTTSHGNNQACFDHDKRTPASKAKRRISDCESMGYDQIKRARVSSMSSPLQSRYERVLQHDIVVLQDRRATPQASMLDQHWQRLQQVRSSGLLGHGSTNRSTSQQKVCSSVKCRLANTVVYPVPCVSRTPYIVADLLGKHDSVLTPSLSHWVREVEYGQSEPQLVGESQAYVGMRKIVLVESKRREAVEAVIKRLLALGGQGLRETVEIWDWRMLEAIDSHETTNDATASWLIGTAQWDDVTKASFFRASRAWLR